MATGIQNNGIVGFGITPQPGVLATSGNFKTTYDFTTQYAPEKAGELFDPFDHSTLMGILEAMGATEEYGKGADTHYWSEAGALMPVIKANNGVYDSVVFGTKSGYTQTITGSLSSSAVALPVMKGDILQVVSGAAVDKVVVAIVNPTTHVVTVKAYNNTTFNIDDGAQVIVSKIGNEQTKGSDPLSGAIDLKSKILKNYFKISTHHHAQNLSDVPNKTWFSVNGQYYWTTAELDAARQRFLITRDYDLLTSEKVDASTGGASLGLSGMEGVFDAIRDRGTTWAGGDFLASGLTDIETLIKRLEIAGAAKANMFLCNTSDSLKFDKAFAGINNVGTNGTPVAGKGNYGSFVNKPDNLLYLGFKGVEWGGYSFYKKTLDAFTNPTSPFHEKVNGISTVSAIMIPVGQTAVAPDMQFGKRNVPYITVMYKGGNGEDRRLKTTMRDFNITGSDKYEVDFLSEFSTRVACANKFVLFEK